ncbi:GNAT family N-acetyltransferase [Chloroflexota bacterium]
MQNNPGNLIRVKRSQVKSVVEVISRAFYDDPLFAGYFFPDTSQRDKLLPRLIEYWIRHDLYYGEVYATSTGMEGIAAWLPSERADRTLWRRLRTGSLFIDFTLGRELKEKIKISHNVCAGLHDRYISSPHYYLEFIAVDPDFQGKGYASRLLRGMLPGLDSKRLPSYLETNNEKNIPLYQHFGYKLLEYTTIPKTNVRNYAMLRDSNS